MNYFEYETKFYGKDKDAMDGNPQANQEGGTKENEPKAPHGQESSAKVIKEFSRNNRILSSEELIAHRKVCKAKPGNCPFEKALDEVDEVTPNEIKVSSQDVFNRLAQMLTQLFLVAKNIAKPAIIEVEKREGIEKVGGDTSEEAKIVAETLERGIERMVEYAQSKGCEVDMDKENTKYIVKAPIKD